jgi:hypothetical protein
MWFLYWLACAEVVPNDKDGTSLPLPWSALAPPVGDGHVQEVGALSLHVVYRKPTEDKDAIGGRWLAHFRNDGWSLDGTRSAGPLQALDLSKDAERLTLMVSAARERVDIQVEIVDP